jgi:hypothetical protein
MCGLCLRLSITIHNRDVVTPFDGGESSMVYDIAAPSLWFLYVYVLLPVRIFRYGFCMSMVYCTCPLYVYVFLYVHDNPKSNPKSNPNPP